MSPLLCPVDGDELELVILDAMLPIEAVGHQCERCGGVLLDRVAQKRVLGQGLAVAGEQASTRSSPRSGQPMVRMHAGEVELDGCAETGEIWFDRGEVLVVRRMVERLRVASGRAAQTTPPDPDRPDPLRALEVCCADCGAALEVEGAPHDSPIGLVCDGCAQRGFGDGAAQAGRRELEHEAGRVVVEHAPGARYRGEVRVTLGFDGGLDATFVAPPGFWRRLFGGRTVELGIPALSAAFHVRAAQLEALRDFVRQRGPLELLLDLAALGEVQVELGARALGVRVSATGSGGAVDAALRCEQGARRLLELYARFSAARRDTPPPRRGS